MTAEFQTKDAYVAGDLVALPRRQRKIAVILGPSRLPGKLRIAVWRHTSRRWTASQAHEPRWFLGLAPETWPQTRAARKLLASTNGWVKTADGNSFATQAASPINPEKGARLQALNQRLSDAFFGKRGSR